MKIIGVAAALAIAAALASFGLSTTTQPQVVQAQSPAGEPQRPLLFVPGMLGSMLCTSGAESEQAIVWGTIDAIGEFPALALRPDAHELEPCGLIREVSFLGVFTQTVYGPFIERLEAAGYREGETLFVFDYDWRLSVFDNAKRLAAFVEETIPGTGAIDIVGHSMGGLVARTYALNEGGAPRIARLVSAGSPWRGSVQVFELLKGGWGLGNVFLGGLDGFRRTIVSFPSTFEMMPRYDGCCGGEAGAAAFDATSLDAWTALNWPGIDKDGLPDLIDAGARQARLRDIAAAPLPGHIEEALVIGVDQRTPEHYELKTGDGEAQLSVGTSWEGDGTVMRDSALLEARATYPTSFATHDAILNDASVQDFVLAALTEGPAAAIGKVPVRERTSILTTLGELVELVGVAIATDQPIYRTGTVAKLTVHLRLGVDEPVDAGAITMTAALPGAPAIPVTLTPDAQASDPANPFEQSFSGTIETGETSGDLTVRVTVNDGSAVPRMVTRTVPLLAL